MGSVGLSDLGDEVFAMVAEYFGEVERAAEEDVRAAAEMAKEAVVAYSPERSGRYARGWAVEPDSEDPAAKAYRVFNKAKPGLTHLLEKGHGGPHPAGAHPHIEPAAKVGVSELERRMYG